MGNQNSKTKKKKKSIIQKINFSFALLISTTKNDEQQPEHR